MYDKNGCVIRIIVIMSRYSETFLENSSRLLGFDLIRLMLQILFQIDILFDYSHNFIPKKGKMLRPKRWERIRDHRDPKMNWKQTMK